MKALRITTIMLFSIALWNCTDPIETDAENAEDPLVSEAQGLVSSLSTEVPEWQKLFDFAENFEREEPAHFATRWVQYWGDAPASLEANMSIWDHNFDDTGATVSTFNSYVIGMEYGQLPQSTDYPQKNLEALDKKLRIIATLIALEKVRGRQVLFKHHYPDGAVDLGFPNEADFKEYISGFFRVTKAKEAEMAENMQVEYYVPFPEPIESYIDRQGFTLGYTVEQKALLAQFVLDTVSDEVRKIFSGTLVVTSHAESASAGSIWNKLNFSSYDEIHFTLVPSCEGGAVAAKYLDDQFEHISTVLAEHPGLRWGIAQLALYQPILTNCDSGDFASYQKSMLLDIFHRSDKLATDYPLYTFSGVFSEFLQGGNVVTVQDYWAGN